MSIVPYVQALRSKDNVIVNRAAEALGTIGDPEAISPLIDALVTTHKYLIQPAGGGGPGEITAGFGTGGGDIIEIEFEHDDGRYVYELEIINPSGRVVEVKVDARTAEILEREEDE